MSAAGDLEPFEIDETLRDLVVLLEGEISVTSDVGNGTSVRFRIPVQTV